jgi:hypothetical protein
METLIEIIVAIAVFIFEVTIQSVVIGCISLLSLFSPRYRAMLRQHWNTSNWERFAMILGGTLYAAGIAFAILVWLQVQSNGKSTAAGSQPSALSSIQFTNQDPAAMPQPKKVDSLVEAAAHLVQRKLNERKAKSAQEKAAQDSADQPKSDPPSLPASNLKPN